MNTTPKERTPQWHADLAEAERIRAKIDPLKKQIRDLEIQADEVDPRTGMERASDAEHSGW